MIGNAAETLDSSSQGGLWRSGLEFGSPFWDLGLSIRLNFTGLEVAKLGSVFLLSPSFISRFLTGVKELFQNAQFCRV